jgi:hypothetical protein
MIEKSKTRKGYYSVNSILEEVKECFGVDEPTAKDVLKYLLGNGDEHGFVNNYSSFVVYKYDEISKRNIFQRFNMLWVYPLFFLTIPFQFLFTGQIGFNRNSKIGRIVNWLVNVER